MGRGCQRLRIFICKAIKRKNVAKAFSTRSLRLFHTWCHGVITRAFYDFGGQGLILPVVKTSSHHKNARNKTSSSARETGRKDI